MKDIHNVVDVSANQLSCQELYYLDKMHVY